jgi:hypothetical protein
MTDVVYCTLLVIFSASLTMAFAPLVAQTLSEAIHDQIVGVDLQLPLSYLKNKSEHSKQNTLT